MSKYENWNGKRIGCGKKKSRIDKALNRFTEIANDESAAIHCFTFVYQTDGRIQEKMLCTDLCRREEGGS